jgi:hypothetical protein
VRGSCPLQARDQKVFLPVCLTLDTKMMDFKQSFEIKAGDENEAAIRDYARSNIEDGGAAVC